ncbi:MAG: aspartate-semialdehyde dehydrogenase, partial [Pseudomonadales bacterium]|nr:aspartate-semialdehyde dehydrogenase [Pseudomonadales bacterium]
MSVDKVNVAVVGATGAVGEAMLEILAERKFPVDKVFALASERSEGKRVSFGDTTLVVENLADFDFSQVQIGLFSAGGSISAKFAPIAAEQGCVVIDNTSHFRRDPNITLIVPEVNSHRLGDYKNTNIIANPNCSTIQMLVALKPIYDAVGIKRINVATYQAVSGTGKEAIEELASQQASLLKGQPIQAEVYP